MYAEFSGQDNASDECEECCKNVQDNQDNRNGKALHECRYETIDEHYPGKGCNEDRIVDARWVPSKCTRDDISYQASDDDGKEKLKRPEDGLSDLHFVEALTLSSMVGWRWDGYRGG